MVSVSVSGPSVCLDTWMEVKRNGKSCKCRCCKNYIRTNGCVVDVNPTVSECDSELVALKRLKREQSLKGPIDH